MKPAEAAAPAEEAAPMDIDEPEASSENAEGANSKKAPCSGAKRKSMASKEETPAAKEDSGESPPKKTKIADAAAAAPAADVAGRTCAAS